MVSLWDAERVRGRRHSRASIEMIILGQVGDELREKDSLKRALRPAGLLNDGFGGDHCAERRVARVRWNPTARVRVNIQIPNRGVPLGLAFWRSRPFPHLGPSP